MPNPPVKSSDENEIKSVFKSIIDYEIYAIIDIMLLGVFVFFCIFVEMEGTIKKRL